MLDNSCSPVGSASACAAGKAVPPDPAAIVCSKGGEVIKLQIEGSLTIPRTSIIGFTIYRHAKTNAHALDPDRTVACVRLLGCGRGWRVQVSVH